MLGAQGCINNSSGNSCLLLLIDSDLFDSVVAVKFVSSSVGRLGEILTTMVNRMLIACSYRRHGQDKTVMSCQCRRCEQAIRDEDVLSCSTASVELVQRPSRQFHVVLEKIFNNSVCYMRSWSVKDQRPCSSESVTQSPAAALRWSRHGIKYTRTVCAPAHARVLERENCTATKKQPVDVDKPQWRLSVTRTVAACMYHSANGLLNVQRHRHLPPPRRVQRRRRLDWWCSRCVT